MASSKHKVVPREIGMIRIYRKPSDRKKRPGIRGLMAGRPMYRDLIDAAKADVERHDVSPAEEPA